MNEIQEKDEKKEERKPVKVRNTSDLQRLKLEKLMKNPDKPIIIPEKPKERGVPLVPDFVRNVMGSSAGAGSGEFHVYRHLRRKEFARQRYMKEQGERDRLDNEYKQKLEDNRKAAEERTEKKRKKRQKRKNRQNKKPKKQEMQSSESSSSEDECEENADQVEDNKETKIEEDTAQPPVEDVKQENTVIETIRDKTEHSDDAKSKNE